MAIRGPRMYGWTVVLRRQPVRMVEGRAEGGYTDVFELICRDCGDDPGLGNGSQHRGKAQNCGTAFEHPLLRFPILGLARRQVNRGEQ